MKQAILITAYTNIDHLNFLTDSLSAEYMYYIHVDKKSNIDQCEIEKLSEKKNVVLISQKYNVTWGGINHLKAILFLLQNALKDSDIEYFHLITGHDYPIKSSSEMTSFLEKNRGKEFLEYNKLPYNRWENGGYDRLLYYNVYDCFNGRKGWRNKMIKKLISIQRYLGLKRKYPKDFPQDLYGGSTYWTLSRGCIEYVFNYMKENPWYLRRFKYTFCSEEFFFQTLVLNSPFKENAVNNSKRFIVWEERNGNFPANLDMTDYDDILNSDAFFARKFEPKVSDTLITKLKSKKE